MYGSVKNLSQDPYDFKPAEVTLEPDDMVTLDRVPNPYDLLETLSDLRSDVTAGTLEVKDETGEVIMGDEIDAWVIRISRLYEKEAATTDVSLLLSVLVARSDASLIFSRDGGFVLPR